MTAFAFDPRQSPAAPKIAAIGAGIVGAALLVASARHFGGGAPTRIDYRSIWLTIHLATVIPALPLGAYVMVARKGDRTHKMLGRIWAILMLVTAAASFGVQTSGHLSWIHLLSALVLVSVPRGVAAAIKGDIAKHKRIMLTVFASMVIAGLFVFIPGRMFGNWLFG